MAEPSDATMALPTAGGRVAVDHVHSSHTHMKHHRFAPAVAALLVGITSSAHSTQSEAGGAEPGLSAPAAATPIALSVGRPNAGVRARARSGAKARAKAPVPTPAPPAVVGLPIGSVAPDFALIAADGTPFQLSAWRGRAPVVMVFFRGTW